MDLLSALLSVNKVALIFFILTLGFVIYELSMFITEKKLDKTPHVPKFDPNVQNQSTVIPVSTPIQHKQPVEATKTNRLLPLLIASALLIILGVLAFIYRPATITDRGRMAPVRKLSPTPTIIIPTSVVTKFVPTSIALITEVPTPTTSTVKQNIIPTEPPTATPTTRPVVTVIQVLPNAGTYHYLSIITLLAFTIVLVSIVF